MAFVGAGAAVFPPSNNISSPHTLSPTKHASTATGDLMVLVTSTRRNVTAAPATPSGWNLVSGFPKRSATAAGGSIFVFTRIADGTSTDNPAVVWSGLNTGNSGDSTSAFILSYSDTTETLHGTIGVTDVSGSNPYTVPGLTTTVNNALVISTGIRIEDTAATFTYAGLYTERVDAATVAGTGHATFAGDFIKTPAGATGTTTVSASRNVTVRVLIVTLAFEPVATGTAHESNPSDTLSLSDSESEQIGKGVAPSDSVTLSDAEATQRNTQISPPDSASVADSATLQRNVEVAAADTAALSDSAATSQGHAASGSDTLSLSDSASPQQGKEVTSADSAAVADSATISEGHAAAGADTLSLTDSAALQRNTQIFPPDSVGVADSATPDHVLGTINVTPSDTLTPADSVTPSEGHAVAPSDTLTLSDSPATQSNTQRTAADTLTLADAAGTQSSTQNEVNPADALVLSDAARKDLVLTAADTAALADSATPSKGHFQTPADSASVADFASTQAGFQAASADSAAVADSATVSEGHGVAAADTSTPTDSVRSDSTKAAADTAALADSASTDSSAAGEQNASDTLNVADSVSRDLTVLLADAASLDDAATPARSSFLTAPDTIALSDSAATLQGHARLPMEMLGISDSPALTIHGLAGDAAGVADAAVTSEGHALAPADAASLADAFRSDTQRTYADSIALTDASTRDSVKGAADTLGGVETFDNAPATLTSFLAGGTVSVTGGKLRVVGNGSGDIWGNTDTSPVALIPVTGTGAWAAEVDVSEVAQDDYPRYFGARAGTAANAAHVAILCDAGRSFWSLMRRPSTSAASEWLASGPGRSVSTLTSFRFRIEVSSDRLTLTAYVDQGSGWQQIASYGVSEALTHIEFTATGGATNDFDNLIRSDVPGISDATSRDVRVPAADAATLNDAFGRASHVLPTDSVNVTESTTFGGSFIASPYIHTPPPLDGVIVGTANTMISLYGPRSGEIEQPDFAGMVEDASYAGAQEPSVAGGAVIDESAGGVVEVVAGGGV
jgi:hypothetical protein